MYSRFVIEADARELRALLGIAVRLGAKVGREGGALAWTLVRERARAIWSELREGADRGARGWR